MKAVVYSFDAYVSVVIALIGVGLLLTYSHIQSNYIDYYQAKILSLDAMRVLIEQNALTNEDHLSTAGSYLDLMIPAQYSFMLYDSEGNSIQRGNVDNYKKIKVSTSILIPVEEKFPTESNPYKYKTCTGYMDACGSISEKPITPDDWVSYKECTLVIAI